MKKVIFFYFGLLTILTYSQAQNTALDRPVFIFDPGKAEKIPLYRAKRFYEDRDLKLAERDLLKAIKTPYSSHEEYAKTMNYFVLIMAELYCSSESIVSNLGILKDMQKAYSNCREYDKKKTYTANLSAKMTSVGDTLLVLSNQNFEETNYDLYLTLMDHYMGLIEKSDVNKGPYYIKMIEACIETNQMQRALSYWEKMIDTGYEAEKGYEKMVAFFYSQGHYDKADSFILMAKDFLPMENSAIAKVEIQRLMDKGLMFKARTKAEQVLSQDPSNFDVLFLLGMINVNLRNTEGAINTFKKIANSNTNHFETHLELGKLFWSDRGVDGNLKLAKQYLEKAEQLNPSDSSTLELLKRAYIELGDEFNFSRVLSKIQGG